MNYDNIRIRKTCRTDSITERGSRGIPWQDNREYHCTNGGKEKGNWQSCRKTIKILLWQQKIMKSAFRL